MSHNPLVGYNRKNRSDAAEHQRRTGEVICCPKCLYRSINFRKMKGTWICRHCGHEFDKPAQPPQLRMALA